MHNAGNILIAISLIVAWASMIFASRKNGFMALFSLSFKDRYVIERGKLEDFSRVLLTAATCSTLLGLAITPDLVMILEFTLINLFFIGYALAWEMLVKPRGKS